MQPVFFTSVISKKHRDDFERIMFFHSQQNQFTEQITHVINTFGFPTIIESGDALRIVIAGLEDCQTLAAYDSEDDDAVLLGVIVYYRKSVEEVVVLHVAVAEE